MLVLAVETSGPLATFAVCDDHRCLLERPVESAGKRRGQTLVAEVTASLRQLKVRPSDCELVGVSIGPGSFTGLRVGVVFAKTFAYATGRPLCAVETPHCIAAAMPDDVSRVFVVCDAQRGELYTAQYDRNDEGQWQRVGSIEIVDAHQFAQQRAASDVVVGPALEKFESLLAGRCQLAERDLWHPRASYVARLALQRFRDGHTDDPWTLEPLYVRKSYAEERELGSDTQA